MDNTDKRKLTMPAWHVPYLEKHRIYELFHELARELLIQQPMDHVLFMKQILGYATKSRDNARIILLASPRVNVAEVAAQLAQVTGQMLITESMLLKQLHTQLRVDVSREKIIMALFRLTNMDQAKRNGWIMTGCIKNDKEAKRMLQIGILPTHVFHLIPPFSPDLTKLLYCNVTESWPEHRRTIVGVRDAFKSKLVEVPLLHTSVSDVAEKCVELSKLSPYIGGPMVPRVFLIGPRGSGRRTQAILLAKNLNVVHISFEYLLCQTWISRTELATKLQNCGDDASYHSELLAQVLDRRILEQDCLTQGWVLTGFPFTVMDFRYLDCLDTPPNRVVFLEADLNVCRDRLITRRTNKNTGSLTNITSEEEEQALKLTKKLGIHPKNMITVVNAELNFYCEHYGEMRKYCGDTAVVINGDQPERLVQECILAFISRSSPATGPRTPYILDTSEVMQPAVPQPTFKDTRTHTEGVIYEEEGEDQYSLLNGSQFAGTSTTASLTPADVVTVYVSQIL